MAMLDAEAVIAAGAIEGGLPPAAIFARERR